MLATAAGQCSREASSLPAQVAANALDSLHSLHDYVSVMDLHEVMRDRKGKITTRDYRRQTIVAHGQMYVRELQPGEEPSLPESAGSLSPEYRVSPAPDSFCRFLPCGTNPGEFLQVDNFPAVWDVLAVRESELNGAPALVLDLRAKHLPHRAYRDAGTAWVDPEHCRLLRLITVSLERGDKRLEETTDLTR